MLPPFPLPQNKGHGPNTVVSCLGSQRLGCLLPLSEDGETYTGVLGADSAGKRKAGTRPVLAGGTATRSQSSRDHLPDSRGILASRQTRKVASVLAYLVGRSTLSKTDLCTGAGQCLRLLLWSDSENMVFMDNFFPLRKENK